MIGVVVWSNRPRQQAVIWCEDHAALAYLSGEEHCTGCAEWPEPGDILELETELVGELRCARKVQPLTNARLPLLPELLRRSRGGPDAPSRHLMVVASGSGRAPAKDKTARLPRRSNLGVAAG